jgi:hypothetical protein
VSKPDYLIYRLKEKNPLMNDTIKEINDFLGIPIYKGQYGYVWKIMN